MFYAVSLLQKGCLFSISLALCKFEFFRTSHFADFPHAPISWDAQFPGIVFFCNVIFVSSWVTHNSTRPVLESVLAYFPGSLGLPLFNQSWMCFLVENGLHLFSSFTGCIFCCVLNLALLYLRCWEAFYDAFKALPTLKKYFESADYKTMHVSLWLCWEMLAVPCCICMTSWMGIMDYLHGYHFT